MSEIKLYKLASGEEIIAKAVSTKSGVIEIEDSVSLVYHQVDNGRMSVGFAPFMPYAGDKVTLRESAVAAESVPNDQILQEYNRVFSNIVIAPANSI